VVGLGGLKHLSTNEKSEPTGFSNLPRSSENKKRETYGNMLIIPDLERSVKANHMTGGNCPKRFLSILVVQSGCVFAASWRLPILLTAIGDGAGLTLDVFCATCAEGRKTHKSCQKLQAGQLP